MIRIKFYRRNEHEWNNMIWHDGIHTGIMSAHLHNTQSTHYIYKFKYFLSTINFKCKKYFLKI